MGSFAPFLVCYNLLRFNFFACLWCNLRQLLTLFHTKRTHAPSTHRHRTIQAVFGSRFAQAKTFFEI